MRGGVSHVWNGAGDGTCHSSVVAPGPHGLAAAIALGLKRLIEEVDENTRVPAPEMKAPIDDTKFQVA